MQINPMIFIPLIKQCTAGEETKQTMLNWLKQSNLVSFQAQGCALSEQLIRSVSEGFSATLQAVSAMDNNPVNKEACQQLFIQISQFYSWLNSLSGKTAVQIEQEWNNNNQSQLPTIDLAITDSNPLPQTVATKSQNPVITYAPHTVPDNRFD